MGERITAEMVQRLHGLAKALDRRRYPENAALVREAIAALSSPAPAAGGAEVVACWRPAGAIGGGMLKLRPEYREGYVLYTDHARLLAEAKQRAAAMEAALRLIEEHSREGGMDSKWTNETAREALLVPTTKEN